MKSKLLFILTLFVISCNTQSNEPDNSEDTSLITENDTNVKVAEKESTVDSLNLYFENPVDFFALKKQTEHMHTGGTIKLSNKYFYAVDDKKYKYYDYWAIEFLNKIEGTGNPLCFKVLKPWDTWKASQYASDNEILIGIKSMLNWKGLGASNFVKMEKEEITNKFNQPDFVKNECLIYHRNGKILIFNMKNGKVRWFKYFWLREPVKNIDELPDKCFRW